ncbi:MAG: HAD family phosphatase [Proteobacteria bacterium]|nr:HAD family phosphatase [Pseudomonadota bacterium]
MANDTAPHDIALVLADVDGTLVTQEKVLTSAARAAVDELRRAGIGFAITSGRPPRGMAMLTGLLGIDMPVAGFNGGVIVAPDLATVLSAHTLAAAAVGCAMELLARHGLDAWVYTETRWLVRDPAAPHVDREARTVQFAPEVVRDLDAGSVQEVVKIVGVSDDAARMRACAEAAGQALGEDVVASLSQPYYLDITQARANKGAVVDALSERTGIARTRIATIGDMPNDVAMFRRAGVSIAMGNAEDKVKQQARYVTDSNEEDGFAKAIRRFILQGARP